MEEKEKRGKKENKRGKREKRRREWGRKEGNRTKKEGKYPFFLFPCDRKKNLETFKHFKGGRKIILSGHIIYPRRFMKKILWELLCNV